MKTAIILFIFAVAILAVEFSGIAKDNGIVEL